MNDIFDVLAEPMRRDILVHLHNAAPGDLSVGDVVTAVGSTQPTVSKHLKVLRDAGLVTVREVGQHRFYRVSPEPLAIVAGWVAVMNGGSAVGSPAAVERLLPDVDAASFGRTLGRIAGDVVALLGDLPGNARSANSR